MGEKELRRPTGRLDRLVLPMLAGPSGPPARGSGPGREGPAAADPARAAVVFGSDQQER